ncbi:MAG TPA: 3-hydroxyacyl-CoA dehydrogenase family protein [Dehalococcoidales bacterium]|nr:3-hydroxyacyl-CoA dehydrogenase family protein [Dehalococcoidales bacterium]
MEIKNVTVLGAGAMGHGIAQVFATAGYNVVLEDITMEFATKGLEGIKKFLAGSIEKKRLTQAEADAIVGRIRLSADLTDAGANADLIIEAIIEDTKIKQATFKKLDEVCPAHTIFASNTSYQSVTEISSITKRPDKFVGMHFFNPPQLMKGLEIVQIDKTTPEIVTQLMALAKKIGKDAAVCKDAPGFIANRILQIQRAESLKLYDEAVASAEDIDKAFKAAYGFRMGPIELADMVGLEIALKGAQTFYDEFKRDLFRPSRALTMKVRAGDFGRKTGQGFYSYKK